MFTSFTLKLIRFMDVVAGTCLTFLIILTACDVVLRYFGMPILGAYELVSMGGGIIIAFAMSATAKERGHINVDFVVASLSKVVQKWVDVVTKSMGIIVYFLLSWSNFRLGLDFVRTREVSQTLHFPYYPIAWTLSFCFLVLCFVVAGQVFEILYAGGTDE